MTHIACRLTVKNWDQLRNPTLGNRVWAIFTFYSKKKPPAKVDIGGHRVRKCGRPLWMM